LKVLETRYIGALTLVLMLPISSDGDGWLPGSNRMCSRGGSAVAADGKMRPRQVSSI
jgi:hypothetical protein